MNGHFGRFWSCRPPAAAVYMLMADLPFMQSMINRQNDTVCMQDGDWSGGERDIGEYIAWLLSVQPSACRWAQDFTNSFQAKQDASAFSATMEYFLDIIVPCTYGRSCRFRWSAIDLVANSGDRLGPPYVNPIKIIEIFLGMCCLSFPRTLLIDYK